MKYTGRGELRRDQPEESGEQLVPARPPQGWKQPLFDAKRREEFELDIAAGQYAGEYSVASLGYSVWGASNPHLEERSFAHARIADEDEYTLSEEAEMHREREAGHSRDDKPWKQPMYPD